MPEMPGVMTDILISMDDRLGLEKIHVCKDVRCYD